MEKKLLSKVSLQILLHILQISQREEEVMQKEVGQERVSVTEQANPGNKLEGPLLCLHSPNVICAFPRVVEKKTYKSDVH